MSFSIPEEQVEFEVTWGCLRPAFLSCLRGLRSKDNIVTQTTKDSEAGGVKTVPCSIPLFHASVFKTKEK